jgi:hypothetical protein
LLTSEARDGEVQEEPQAVPFFSMTKRRASVLGRGLQARICARGCGSVGRCVQRLEGKGGGVQQDGGRPPAVHQILI